MSRGLAGVGLAGVMLEAGCVWMWVVSPQLTVIYNAELTARFFERLPWLRVFVPPSAAELDVSEMVVRLEVGLGLMILGYLGGLWAIGAATGGIGHAERGGDAARAESGGGAGARVGWLVVGCAMVFRLTLLVLPGLFSTDVFSYVMYGRIAGISGQNPYVLAPSSFPSDPFLSWVFPFWRDQASVYGPLWTDFSALLARLSGGWGNFEQVMVYRASLAAIEAGTLVVLWWVLGKTTAKGRMACWAMYAWNPLVLFDLVGGAHNDVMMVALLLLGVGVIVQANGQQHGRWVLGLLAITLGALVKYATGLVTLLWAVTWAAQGGSARIRLARITVGLGVPALLTAILWWPWLQTNQALLPLGDSASGRLVINSAPDLVALTVADQLLQPNGIDRETAHAAARFWMRAITRAVFSAYLIWEIWRLWQRPALLAALEASTRVLLVLPLLVMTWVWSWYFSWALVLAALLGRQSRLAWLVVAYTLGALPVVYAHQYLNDGLSGAFVAAFALAPLLTLLAPTRGSNGRPRSRSPYQPASGSLADR